MSENANGKRSAVSSDAAVSLSTAKQPERSAAVPVVGRLAPSPSARMHAGNIFSSLVAWICAKRADGRILLRIEDLDRQRCKPAFSEAVMRDYERLGLTWDNEEVVYQSQRDSAYQDVFSMLEERDLVYPCFCSRADLHAASAPHGREGFIYAGTCRNLTAEQRAERAAAKAPSWRVRVDGVSEISFVDRFQGGETQLLERDCGDFIIRRSDGMFGYQLAVVVDDLFQGVNQVVRGQDLLGSTPRQIYLRKLLDPAAFEYEYAHVPLFVDGEGRRLAKRDRDANLDGLVDRYGSVPALYGAIAGATGLMPTCEPVLLEELLAEANLDALVGLERIVW